MVCGSCGIKNVEFATTCFACGKALGRGGEPRLTVPTPHEYVPPVAHAPETRKAPQPSAGPAGTNIPGIIRAIRAVVILAVLWNVFGGFGAIRREFESMLESAQQAVPEPEATPAESGETAAPAAVATESTVTEIPPTPVEEKNGFRLAHFSLTYPDERPNGPFRLGDTVRGRSEITGFAVNKKGELDVKITFAFRDPNGELVEPISPSVLRQKAESDTLYTDFYYDVAKTATEGHYDLELGVDDAVSGRSVRFHKTIPVHEAGDDEAS